LLAARYLFAEMERHGWRAGDVTPYVSPGFCIACCRLLAARRKSELLQ